jgi:hypothetical protein
MTAAVRAFPSIPIRPICRAFIAVWHRTAIRLPSTPEDPLDFARSEHSALVPGGKSTVRHARPVRSDAYPALAEGGYGWEKLMSEMHYCRRDRGRQASAHTRPERPQGRGRPL